MNCYHCEKGVMYGRSHTHHRGVAGGRWKKRAQKTQRIFKPNLQPVVIKVGESYRRVKLCNKCVKRIKKDILEGKKPFLTLAHIPSNITNSLEKLEETKEKKSEAPAKKEKAVAVA